MISNQNLEEMDYQESLKYEDWKNERGWADLIMKKVYDLQLNVGLDKLTRGRGDCFPITILQQLKRPDVRWLVNPSMQRMAQEMDQMGLRRAVKNFIVQSKHPKVQEMKRNYEAGAAIVDKISWSCFWNKMMMVSGLVSGLGSGMVLGSVLVLVSGFILGLISSLIFDLVLEYVFGLVSG